MIHHVEELGREEPEVSTLWLLKRKKAKCFNWPAGRGWLLKNQQQAAFQDFLHRLPGRVLVSPATAFPVLSPPCYWHTYSFPSSSLFPRVVNTIVRRIKEDGLPLGYLQVGTLSKQLPCSKGGYDSATASGDPSLPTPSRAIVLPEWSPLQKW